MMVSDFQAGGDVGKYVLYFNGASIQSILLSVSVANSLMRISTYDELPLSLRKHGMALIQHFLQYLAILSPAHHQIHNKLSVFGLRLQSSGLNLHTLIAYHNQLSTKHDADRVTLPSN